MKGFYIYVKNELLEPKHFKAMTGNSIWLFLWLLDAITEVNEDDDGIVSYGRPITYEKVAVDLGLPERNYGRYLKVLREAGYIKTFRTPYGLIITVRKAKKVFGQRYDKSGTSKVLEERSAKSGISPEKDHRDRPKLSERYDVFGRSNNNKTYNKTLTTTNVVVGETPKFGKTELNLLFDYWESQTGLGIVVKRQANRHACNNLYKQFGTEGVHKLIDGVALSRTDEYAPRIGDFCDLQQKLNQFLVWGRGRNRAAAVNQPVRFGGKK